MGVLGKDILDIYRPATHTKVQFGKDGYWVERVPMAIPYGTTLLAILEFDAKKYSVPVERLEEMIAARDKKGTLDAFLSVVKAFMSLPLYSLYIHDRVFMEPEIGTMLYQDKDELALADRIFEDDGTILNKYLWARDDIFTIQKRYSWFLDEVARSRGNANKKGQKKLSMPEQISASNMGAYISGVSLGESMEIDAPQINVQYALYEPEAGEPEIVEKMYFDRLCDFVYVEFMRGLQKGYTPRRCSNCGKWFLQKPGVDYSYCTRVAPGETEKTCRDVGSLSSFREKVQENDIWQIHQRAYKKYYARVLKNRMSKPEFEAWARQAEQIRDAALPRYDRASAQERARLVEQVRRELNAL